MSFDVNWNIDKYREDHECDEHWELRKAFMERWKSSYPEERLVCLARVFANMEFMGCRYPVEIMQEVARLSKEVAEKYRKSKKHKLQRTFVSASDAAEDRAKGIKRKGGVVIEEPSPKSTKIDFVPEGHEETIEINESDDDVIIVTDNVKEVKNNKEINEETKPKCIEITRSETVDVNEYLNEMKTIKCLDIRCFQERMFQTAFGRMVLLIRPWTSKLSNLLASCQACKIAIDNSYENGVFALNINGRLVARASGDTRAEAKSIVELLAWNRLKEEMISVLVKEQWIADNDTRISVSDVRKHTEPEFGTPVENSVATKMMKMMGWKGGGLGADAQGIVEPIKPSLQMVSRAGLGSGVDSKELRRRASELMDRYRIKSALDVDLVFSSDFTKDERALMHKCAQAAGLASRSYGTGEDRFLVVKKKLDPFSLTRAIIENGGNTPKYQVFIPTGLGRSYGR